MVTPRNQISFQRVIFSEGDNDFGDAVCGDASASRFTSVLEFNPP